MTTLLWLIWLLAATLTGLVWFLMQRGLDTLAARRKQIINPEERNNTP